MSWAIAGTSFTTTFRIDCLGVSPRTCIFSESGELVLSIGVVQSGEQADPSLAQRRFITQALIICQRAWLLWVKIWVFSLICTSTFSDVRQDLVEIPQRFAPLLRARLSFPRSDQRNRQLWVSPCWKYIGLWGNSEAIDAKTCDECLYQLSAKS